MNYNTNAKITYHTIKDEYKSDILYRNELMNVFNKKSLMTSYNMIESIEDVDFDMIDRETTKVFEMLPKNHTKWNHVLKKAAARFFTEDIRLGFTILFAYETFYLVHELIQTFVMKGILDEYILSKIENILEADKQ
jgi:hypothetical protein